MNIKKTLCLSIATLSLTGCATTTYTFDNKHYKNSAVALAAHDKYLGDLLNNISVLPVQISGTAIVITPSKDTCEALGIAWKGRPNKAVKNYLGTFEESDYAYFSKYLEKSRGFTHVESMIVDYPQVEARKATGNYVAIIYLHMISPTQVGWFLLTPGSSSPKQISFDQLAEPGVTRIDSWVNEIVRNSTVVEQPIKNGAVAMQQVKKQVKKNVPIGREVMRGDELDALAKQASPAGAAPDTFLGIPLSGSPNSIPTCPQTQIYGNKILDVTAIFQRKIYCRDATTIYNPLDLPGIGYSAFLILDDHGQIGGIGLDLHHEQFFLRMREALITKFGAPTSHSTETYSNALRGSFQGVVENWEWPTVEISLFEYSQKITESKVVVVTKAYLNSKATKNSSDVATAAGKL